MLLNIPNNKNDYLVRYFMVGEEITQVDRDFVAQAMSYFSIKAKRDRCQNAQTITAQLPADVQGLTSNRSQDNPFTVTFKTAKRIVAMCSHFAETRAAHHDIIVYSSVDDSPFSPVQ